MSTAQRRRTRPVTAHAVTAGSAAAAGLVVVWWHHLSLSGAVCAPGYGYLWQCDPGHRLAVAGAATAALLIAAAAYGSAWYLLRGDAAKTAWTTFVCAVLFIVATALIVIA